MGEFTPLEKAHALRSTAEWLRDPSTKKCHGTYASTWYGKKTDPHNKHAGSWCALGRLAYQLRREPIQTTMECKLDHAEITELNDTGCYHAAASAMERQASWFERQVTMVGVEETVVGKVTA